VFASGGGFAPGPFLSSSPDTHTARALTRPTSRELHGRGGRQDDGHQPGSVGAAVLSPSHVPTLPEHTAPSPSNLLGSATPTALTSLRIPRVRVPSGMRPTHVAWQLLLASEALVVLGVRASLTALMALTDAASWV
jgi:hypothetical protein